MLPGSCPAVYVWRCKWGRRSASVCACALPGVHWQGADQQSLRGIGIQKYSPSLYKLILDNVFTSKNELTATINY